MRLRWSGSRIVRERGGRRIFQRPKDNLLLVSQAEATFFYYMKGVGEPMALDMSALATGAPDEHRSKWAGDVRSWGRI